MSRHSDLLPAPLEHPTIVVADDHAPTRAALRHALEEGGFEVLGEASNADDAVVHVKRATPDIALLDVRMPGGGIAAAASTVAEVPATKVVMLTVSEDDEDLFAALRVGALGYILKGGPPSELPPLLHRTIAGEPVLPGALLAKVLLEFQSVERRRLFGRTRRDALSQREHEVLLLLEQGASTADIAKALFIAKVTVRSHVASICRKLRVPSRDAALRELRSSPRVEAPLRDSP